MDMKDEKTCMANEKGTTPKKKGPSKVVICNASTTDARMSLEEVVKRYLLKKALELKDDVA